MQNKAFTVRLRRLALCASALLFTFTAAAAEMVGGIKVDDTTGKANPVALEQAVASAIGTRIGKELDLHCGGNARWDRAFIAQGRTDGSWGA